MDGSLQDGVIRTFTAFLLAFVGVVLTMGSSVAVQPCGSGDPPLGGRVIAIPLRSEPRALTPAEIGLKPREVVLTFDDGPVTWNTPAVLDVLRKHCVRATFFMIGNRATAQPAIVGRALADGHSIASHSQSHRNLAKLSHEDAVSDVEAGILSVRDAARGHPGASGVMRILRLPELRSTPALDAHFAARSITVIGNDISPKDWRGDPPQETLARLLDILERRKKGIVTLHDNQRNTTEMLPLLFAALAERGFTVVHLVFRPQ